MTDNYDEPQRQKGFMPVTFNVSEVMTKIVALSVLILLLCATGSAQTKLLNVGGLLLSVSDSRTAQVFHIVDQMSQWDSSVHHTSPLALRA